MRLDGPAPHLGANQKGLGQMNWEEIAVAAPAAFLLGVIVGYAIRGHSENGEDEIDRHLRDRTHRGMASRRRRRAGRASARSCPA